MSNLVAKLRALDGLGACTDEQLAELAKHSEAISVPAGWAFILEGMPGDCCYVVLEGTVSVTRAGEEIRRVEAGALVGELALIDERPRSATCVAVTALELLQLDASEFNGWLQQRPEIRDRLLAAAVPRHEVR